MKMWARLDNSGFGGGGIFRHSKSKMLTGFEQFPSIHGLLCGFYFTACDEKNIGHYFVCDFFRTTPCIFVLVYPPFNLGFYKSASKMPSGREETKQISLL